MSVPTGVSLTWRLAGKIELIDSKDFRKHPDVQVLLAAVCCLRLPGRLAQTRLYP